MATTTNFGWETPDDTDLVKDGAAAMRTLGNAIDTSMVDLKGGTTGQVLAKASNTDMDFTWSNVDPLTILDAKGDLISATAADTPARLAVGSNGETIIADSTTSTGLRYITPPASLPNPIINGNMSIAQRGTAAVTLNAGGFLYPVDRWFASRTSGTSGATAQQISSISLDNFRNALRIQRTAGDTSTFRLYCGQSFETSTSVPFANKTVSLSFWARAGANLSSSLGIRLYSGTGTDQSGLGSAFTGTASPVSTSQSLTTTWTRYVFTGTIASTATQLQAFFFIDPTGTAGAADYFDITGVQIDVGTYGVGALPAYRLSANTVQGELAACQRYYQRISSDATAVYMRFGTGAILSATSTSFVFPYKVTMRTTPTLGTSGSFEVYEGSTQRGTAAPTLTTNGTNAESAALAATIASGNTGYACYLRANNSSSTYLEFSAEL